ncbi:hypothetical protein H696_05299 [Fonticula alba]|uniref:Uncharacterized protein n=1 Tax=Fonticula alba TaxID=691883 RepID=A0A058Z4D3_FONAL|nr:hypothetical protein H696_05299 [Fonticula alba]KCV68382.1 hypothetical protein H696_05299 [Fonticula alba]|eukprot:XP_009497436.1 hypothetical protein H696_05299 [Fonticula alba]
MCLEVRATCGRPAGSAGICPATFGRMCDRLPGSRELFLHWHGRLLVLIPDAGLSGGEIALGRVDIERHFAGQALVRAMASRSAARPSQVDVHLSPGPRPLECVHHADAVREFLRLLDYSVISVGQEIDLPAGGTTVRARVVRLMDTQLRALESGFLSMDHTPAFVHVSTPQGEPYVLRPPRSVLLQVPRLELGVRFPVAERPEYLTVEEDDLLVSERTLRSLEAHFLEPEPTILLGDRVRVVGYAGGGLRRNEALPGTGLLRYAEDVYHLPYTEPPELLALTCRVEWIGDRPPPRLRGIGQLERLLLEAIPLSYSLAGSWPELVFTPSRLTNGERASVEAGAVVPGLTRISFDMEAGGRLALAEADPLAVTLHCGRRRLLLLSVHLAPGVPPLYPGLHLPREVFQSVAESADEGQPGGCLFFLCQGRTFVARLADTHDLPGVVRLSAGFGHFLRGAPEPPPPRVRLRTPVWLSAVHVRVVPARASSGPVAVDLAPRDLVAGLSVAFADMSMALFERRPFREVVLVPEVLLDAEHQEVACGLLRRGHTQVRLYVRDVDLRPGKCPLRIE